MTYTPEQVAEISRKAAALGRTRHEVCNTVLVKLFVPGQPAPDRKTVFAAYVEAFPWEGTRKYSYTVWRRWVRRWRKAHARGQTPDLSPVQRRKKVRPVDERQLSHA